MDMAAKNEVCNVNPDDCKTRFDIIDGKLDDIHRRLFVGNGQPALVTRIDRLEQKEQSRSKLTWMFIAAFVVVVVNQGWSIAMKLNNNQNQTQGAKP